MLGRLLRLYSIIATLLLFVSAGQVMGVDCPMSFLAGIEGRVASMLEVAQSPAYEKQGQVNKDRVVQLKAHQFNSQQISQLEWLLDNVQDGKGANKTRKSLRQQITDYQEANEGIEEQTGVSAARVEAVIADLESPFAVLFKGTLPKNNAGKQAASKPTAREKEDSDAHALMNPDASWEFWRGRDFQLFVQENGAQTEGAKPSKSASIQAPSGLQSPPIKTGRAFSGAPFPIKGLGKTPLVVVPAKPQKPITRRDFMFGWARSNQGKPAPQAEADVKQPSQNAQSRGRSPALSLPIAELTMMLHMPLEWFQWAQTQADHARVDAGGGSKRNAPQFSGNGYFHSVPPVTSQKPPARDGSRNFQQGARRPRQGRREPRSFGPKSGG